jgi:hypothetical protein
MQGRYEVTQVKKKMFQYYLGLKIMYEDNVHKIPVKSNKRIFKSKNLQLCITPMCMCKTELCKQHASCPMGIQLTLPTSSKSFFGNSHCLPHAHSSSGARQYFQTDLQTIVSFILANNKNLNKHKNSQGKY